MSAIKSNKKNIKKIIDEHHHVLFDIEMKQQKIIDEVKEKQLRGELLG